MKKSLTQLLIIAIIFVIAICATCFFEIEILKDIAREVSKNKNDIEKDYIGDDIGPLLDDIKSEFSHMKNSIDMSITLAFTIGIPNAILITVALLQLIARFLYSENSNNKSCLNFTLTSMILTVILSFLWIYNILEFNIFISYIPLVLNLICMILFIIEYKKIKKFYEMTAIKTEVIEEK